MPRIALISELHANYEALKATVEDIRQNEDIRQIFCLGDFVGYGPDPNKVVETIKALEDESYELRNNIGNHDAAAIGRCNFVDLNNEEEYQRVLEEGGFESKIDILKAYRDPETRKYIPVKTEGKLAIEWTINQLTPENLNYLETRLEERVEIMPGVIAVHASPRDTIFEYVRDKATAQKCFESPEMNDVQICFHGHTHVAVTWILKAEERMSYGDSIIVMDEPEEVHENFIELDLHQKLYLINVGAVGQPRGKDRRPTFVIFDTDASTVEFRTVDYDSSTTQTKILNAGLPESLAGRLAMRDSVGKIPEADVEDIPEADVEEVE